MRAAQLENQAAHLTTECIDGLAVDVGVMFSDHKNVYRRVIEKRQRCLLKKISFIRPFLCEDEKILLVTAGLSPLSFIEQMSGVAGLLLKRCLFVFTNKRIFHIPTKPNLSYRYSIAQILYADCRRIGIKGFSLVAEYKSGRKEKFAAKQRRKIKSLLKQIPLDGSESYMRQRTHLCPRCTELLIEGQFTCPNCSLEFKSKKQGRKLSIIYPGGGYFYARHPVLGLADALVEIHICLAAILAFDDAVAGVVNSWAALVSLGLILAAVKALTVRHVNHFIKEYIPKDRNIEILTEDLPALETKPDNVSQPEPEEILCASWKYM